MCGIVGYVGNSNVKEILLNALELLEYRGYDSAGVALASSDNTVTIQKCTGYVKDLRLLCIQDEPEQDIYTCGIGHTRWATHGNVSARNAHPHQCGKVTLVHNGIIENYRELIEDYNLKSQLSSDTDSEAAAALLNYFYDGNPETAIQKTIRKLKGTFALVILFSDRPGTLYAIRNVSPIVVSSLDNCCILASDPVVLSHFSNRYFILPEYHLLEMKKDSFVLKAPDGSVLTPELQTMNWNSEHSDKNGYPFYMEKEIMEQPRVFEDTIRSHIVNGLPSFEADNIPDDLFMNCRRICIVACGTAMYAGLVAQALIKPLLRIPVDVELASEFMYSDPIVDKDTLVIAVSQSGETIDTLEAAKYAVKHGAKCLSILNVKDSSISRVSDYVIYTCAGPEIAVASTKAYTTQLAVFFLIISKLAYQRGIFSREQTEQFISRLEQIPAVIQAVLDRRNEIHLAARKVLESKDLFMIGRGLDYAILLEGALKMKEVSYIHAEAYASGELKHGPIALITQNTPVIAVVTQDRLITKELSNIKEVKSRGAQAIVFIKKSLAENMKEDYDTILLPDMPDEFMVFPAAAALQLLAYYVSADKGFDVDRPRNLAKVVTVE